MFPYIVADIGGTNARFALATAKNGQQFVIENINILSGAEFDTFEDALEMYVDSLDGIKPRAACIAIAGPISGDRVAMTNLSWSFSKQKVKERFGFERFDVINDFAAVAIATSRLNPDDVHVIREGQALPKANKAILGAGTGLGVAGLGYLPQTDSWLPIPSEGGHVNVAPSTAFETDIIKAGMQRFDYVSAEMFISGPGLVNLYTCVCDVEGIAVKSLEPKDITKAALDKSDAQCFTTLETFCSLMGALAGNLVLTYGGKGGVYISGGIVPRFVDFLRQSTFNERFASKGVMSHYVAEVPVNLVGLQETAFLGAAAWLEQNIAQS